MCGIAGYFGKDFKNKNIINSTLKLLHHRGPDSKCFFYTKDNLSNYLFTPISNKFLTKDKSIVKPLPKPKVKLHTKKKEAKKKKTI